MSTTDAPLPTRLSNTREMALRAVALGRVTQSTRGAQRYAEGAYVPRDQGGYLWLVAGGFIASQAPEGGRRPVTLTARGRALLDGLIA